MAIIGGFVSTAGGLHLALERAQAIGAQAFMIFATSPHSWQRRVFSDEEAAGFRDGFTAAGFHSLWFHGTYLMNFGSADSAALKRSTDCLVRELEDCKRLGGRGVIFHLGSHGGRGFDAVLGQIVQAMNEAIERTSEVSVIIENSAGMGGSIGSSLEDVARIFEAVNHPRLQFCLDTQHAFAAGHAIHTPEGLTGYLDRLHELVGIDRLVALHANDSKVPFAGGRDRHENIGAGFIGDDGFRVLTHEPRLGELPFLLEVPGLEKKGPDKPNVDRLRRLADENQ